MMMMIVVVFVYLKGFLVEKYLFAKFNGIKTYIRKGTVGAYFHNCSFGVLSYCKPYDIIIYCKLDLYQCIPLIFIYIRFCLCAHLCEYLVVYKMVLVANQCGLHCVVLANANQYRLRSGIWRQEDKTLHHRSKLTSIRLAGSFFKL
ncbi:hypothetical protein AMTRI_Chr13g124870 [Amborella trichopoda]